MIPVVMVVIESIRNRIIGTFDLDTFESWWVSEPLPGEIDEILDTCWVHGDYHFALARMMDGTYSVFRTNDAGIHWELIWNHSQPIFGMIFMDASWVLFSTADGWYETVNTGAEITQISEGEPDGGVGVRVGLSTLIYHDGDTIWKSPNAARNWSQVFDVSEIAPGEKSPAIAGNIFMVLAGAGPKMLKSTGDFTSWDVIKVFTSDRVIRDIMILDGSTPTPTFIVQVEILSQGIFRYYEVTDGGATWTPKWDRYVSPGKTMTGASVQVPVFGGTDALYFTGGVRYDAALGRYVPALSYSRDGEEWHQINLAATHTSPSTPFLVTQWTTRVWNGPACHNWGFWEVTDHYRWGISWDQSLLINNTVEAELSASADVVLRKSEGLEADARVKRGFSRSIHPDARVKKEFSSELPVGVPLLKTVPKTVNTSSLIVNRNSKTFLQGVPLRKTVPTEFWASSYLKGEQSAGFGLSALLVTSKYSQILLDLEVYFPQFWNIRCPQWKYRVWDSRKGTFD